MSEPKITKSSGPPKDFLMVALGASAGGLEACETFFQHMPDDAGMAFAVVMHLAPDRASALADILGRRTHMTVEQAEDNAQVLPNHVYIIPPNATLTIKGGVLNVEPPDEPRGHRTPIDSLFRSLAEDCGENAVCIMLSGTGTDGTLGLTAVKEHGGMAMAQTLDTAKYDAILRSAIATGLVDHILPVESMPAKLLEYAAHLKTLNSSPNTLRQQIGSYLGTIYGRLHKHCGHDFSQYKESTISRRVERRMKALQIDTVEHYLRVLQEGPEECDRLFHDLLIGVTQFFRNPECFDALARDVLPKLFEGKQGDDQVRVCVVGCASGEEAYTLGILLTEQAEKLDQPPKIQIFATDIDDRGLETGRRGFYPDGIAEHVSAARLQHFFLKQPGGYQVKPALREMVLFSSHSFIKDPPFSRLDLISCRNVMIYLSAELQKTVIALLHYALRSNGYLFLGPSENISSHPELFRTLDKKHRIFARKDGRPQPGMKFALSTAGRPAPTGKDSQTNGPEMLNQLQRLILQQFGPACVIVKETGEAVYFSGKISRYLQHPAGGLQSNVLNMAREGLRTPLRTALHRAVTSRARVMQKYVPVQTNGHVSHVDLSVEPLTAFAGAHLYMVLLEEVASLSPPMPAGSSPSTSVGTPVNTSDGAVPDAGSDEIIRHLEEELRSAQENTQSAFEELETANEELQSANEEYQSTNEELETSKEEMQSSHEELETVNAELGRRVSELDRINSDLQNFLSSTQIATVFLDLEMRIKSFTPAAGTVFRLIAGDVGRPLTDLAARFTGTALVDDIQEVLKTLVPRERQLSLADGRHHQMRILPYRTIHNVIDGVVITFTDVTQISYSRQEAEDAKTFAESIIRTVRHPLLVLDADLRVEAANQCFYDMFKLSARETLNTVLYELGNKEWDIPELRRLLTELLPKNNPLHDFQVKHWFREIGQKTMLLNAHQIQRHDGGAQLVLLAIDDVTERQVMTEALREREERLSFMAEAMPQKIFSALPDGSMNYLNGQWAEFTGLPLDQMLGWGWDKFIYPADLPENILSWKIALDSGEPWEFVHRFRRFDGTYRWHLSRAHAMRNTAGEISLWLGSSTDIHEEKRIEEELRRLNEDLNQFAFAASHDLLEPLRMITSYSELLVETSRDRVSEEVSMCVDYIAQGTQRMRALLADLLSFTEVGGTEAALEPIDLEIVLDTVKQNLQTALSESGTVLTHGPLPTVVGRQVHFVQLFQNLVGNAIKYRGQRSPAVHISAEQRHGEWLFAVADNGRGIAPEYHEQVFGVFKRLHGKEIPGTGIGLAICQRVVERRGGRIWVESEPEHGAKFCFTLPLENGARA